MTLIDTSAWVEALRRDGDEGVRSRVVHRLDLLEADSHFRMMPEKIRS